ncbi:MAG: fibronectin type III domain-containing protein, partial [Chitinophagaceae bacterium]|nr:fibronectin type III domain-containing protein [Chitinophagaceae bacterium]
MNSVGMILFTLIAFFSGLRTEVGSSANTGVAGNKYIYKTGNSTNNDVINSDFFSANTVFACDVPSGVGTGQVNIGSATINFLSAGNNFIVEYGLPGFTPGIDANPGTGGTVVTGIASPIVITGLTGSTAYDVYVRQVCAGPVYSANSSVIQFTTLCPAANVPYAENFDGVTAPAIPSCMLVENANGGNTWRTVGNDFAASSPNIMRVDYETDGTTPANDWFFLHGLNLTGGTSYRLTFKYRNSDATTWVEKMEVKYGTAANAASMTAGTLFSNTNIDFNTWATVDADFTPASSGVYYIGFHGFSDADQAFLCVDDVSVDVTPTCFPPTGLNVTSVTLTSADINWTAASPVPGVGYDLYYSTSSTAPVSGTTPSFAGITGLTQALSGLTHSTTYYVWLRSDCGAGNKSTWTALPTFNTLLINDDAPGAITLTVGAGCTGAIYTNVGATAGTGEVYPSCSGTIQVPVWFKFVAPASGAVRISTDLGTGNTFTDSKVGLFSATNVNDYATFGILSCDDDGGSALGSGFLSVVYATGLTAGNTYYIAVDKSTSSTTNGTFCIAVDELDASMLATANTCGSAYQSPFGSNTTYTGWVPLLDGSSRLVAMVKNPSGGSVSSYSVAQNINAAAVRTDVTSGQRYLDRNFRINNSGSATNVNVQFFFLNSELTALQAADAGVTLANLGVTHQTGSTCQDDFTAANGINSFLAQTVNGTSTDGLVKWIQVQTPSFSNFYLHTSKTPVTLKAFLQGAYNATLSRHNDVTAQWVNVLNAGSFPSGALTQPYSSFGHTGSESVSPGFFTVTGGSDDIVDWVLLELRSAPPPAAPVATRAAFIREDGMIVDLDKVSSVSFRGVANGNYYVTIRHRNHLGIRTSALQLLDGALGSNPAPGVYDFTTALNRAYKDVTISTNEAMAVNGAVYLMWAGNANQDNYVRVTSSAIPVIPSDAATILTILGGTPNGTGTVYSAGDINMDGRTRVTSSA